MFQFLPHKKLLLLLLISFLFTKSFAQPNVKEKLKHHVVKAPLVIDLDSIIERGRSEYGFPGGAIIVADSSGVIYNKNYGLSSIEFQIPVGDSTVFHLASATKLFTGTLAMILAEKGHFSLNDSIGKYLNWVPNNWSAITINQLLNHTSGIPNHFRTKEWRSTSESKLENLNIKESIQYSIREGLQFTPGENFSYNITSYVLFAELVRSSTGKTIPNLMQSQVFTPLKMNSCSYGDYASIIPNRNSIIYKRNEDELVNNIFEYGLASTSAAGLNSNANDIYKFMKSILNDELILSKESRDKMMSPTILNSGENHNYGIGWSINSVEDIMYIGHEGGGCVWIYYLPKSKHYIIFLSNLTGARADKLIEEIIMTLDNSSH